MGLMYLCTVHGGIWTGNSAPPSTAECSRATPGSTCNYINIQDGANGFTTNPNANPTGGSSSSSGDSQAELRYLKKYWYNDGGTLLKSCTSAFGDETPPTGMISELIDSEYDPTFRKWNVIKDTLNWIMYYYASYYSTKIANIYEIYNIAHANPTSLASPYRALKMSELNTYGCQLIDDPTLTYADNLCVRITDICKNN